MSLAIIGCPPGGGRRPRLRFPRQLEYSVPASVYQVLMIGKRSLLTLLALVTGAVMLYANRDWFAQPPIQISHRFDAFGGRFTQAPGTLPLMFEFSRRLKLTSVEVFPLSDLQTNRHPHPLWHLLSDSHSSPTRGFLYGMIVPGMRPPTADTVAEGLDLGVKYRLVIEAGSVKAQHDFILEPAEP